MTKNLVINDKVKYCTECKREMKFIPAVTYIREFRLYLCPTHFTQWFDQWVEKAIQQFDMFSRQDRLLVALSGGKDSMVLWYVLNKLGYNADGFFINLGIKEASDPALDAVNTLARLLHRKPQLIDIKEETGLSLPEIVKLLRSPACSICSRIKKYYFNRTARLGGYRAVATGHNLDDEAAALLSNIIYWKSKYLSKYPVLPENAEFNLPRKVKPLVLMTEEQIRLYAQINKIPHTTAICPLSEGARLKDYKDFIDKLEMRSPGTRRSFYLQYIRKYQKRLTQQDGQYSASHLKKCRICGEPSASDICFVCKIKQKTGKL